MIKHSNFYFLLLLLQWDRAMADSPWTSLLDGSKDNGGGVGGGGFSSGGVGGSGFSSGGVGGGGFSSGGVGGSGFSSGGVGGSGFSSGGVGGSGFSSGGVGGSGFSSGGVGGSGFSSGGGGGGFSGGGKYEDSWFEGEPISAAETGSEVERQEEVAVQGSGWTRYFLHIHRNSKLPLELAVASQSTNKYV
jgi:hypothetical protein